jgi:hypothetical protein
MELKKTIFDDALIAHMDWKRKLTLYIKKDPSVKLNAEEASKDNCCQLGKWIYGNEHPECKAHPEFEAMRIKHAAFHKEAGDVIRLADAGKFQEALQCLEDRTKGYGQASDLVVLAIGSLKKLCAEREKKAA